jgi:hypothetical protein
MGMRRAASAANRYGASEWSRALMTSVRQFDRERQAVERQHDFRDRVGVLVIDGEPGHRGGAQRTAVPTHTPRPN